MCRKILAAVVCLSLLSVASAADPVPPAETGWVELLKKAEKSPWRKVDPMWLYSSEVALDSEKGTKLKATGAGAIWVNGVNGRVSDLLTTQTYGDLEVHVEFFLGKNSNSGIKFQAVYEIQLRDTATKTGELEGDDCGGIYPRAEYKPKYHHIDKGIGPKVNAAKPAGEWQTLDVTFHTARFDAEGKKTQNAKIVKAVLNDKVIHDQQEMLTPTGNNWNKKETKTGPFMLQADHGPVAFRNVKIRPIAAVSKPGER